MALGQAGLPGGPLVVRLLALGEVAVAGAVLVIGGSAPAAALGLVHLGFAAFVLRLRRSAGPGARCGCFGEAEAPAGRLHVVVNLAASGLVAAALTSELPSLASVLGDQPVLGLPYVAAVVVGAWATGRGSTSTGGRPRGAARGPSGHGRRARHGSGLPLQRVSDLRLVLGMLADPAALPEGTRAVVVAPGAEREDVALLAGLAPRHLPLVLSTQAWQDYAVPGAPYVALVDGTSGLVVGECPGNHLRRGPVVARPDRPRPCGLGRRAGTGAPVVGMTMIRRTGRPPCEKPADGLVRIADVVVSFGRQVMWRSRRRWQEC